MLKNGKNGRAIARNEVTAELLVDMEHVCVPLARYEQLINMEAVLAVIQKACKSMESYQVMEFLKMLFWKEPKGGENA